jgi:hypothetical protein
MDIRDPRARAKLIAELGELNAEMKADMERRRAAEPIGRARMQRKDYAGDLAYRRQENATAGDEPGGGQPTVEIIRADPELWGKWFHDMLMHEFTAGDAGSAILRAVMTLIDDEVRPLQRKVRSLERRLGLVTKSARRSRD